MNEAGAVIAVVGAESTGKTTLTEALADALRQQGRRAVVVPEVLRAFCDAQGRTPHRHEQAAIAAEQWRRIEAAALGGSTVLADTTPLMTAVYSEMVFGDRSLYPQAQALQASCVHTLVTGLDIAWQVDGLQRDGPQVRAPVDALIRAALDAAKLRYSVVYGLGPARTAAALAALSGPLQLSRSPTAPEPAPRLQGRCRECLVPGCEHLRAPLLPVAAAPAS